MAKDDLRDKLNDDELDLTMMNLTEVPVKEIAALPRAYKIDLSNNRLTSLPANFAPSLQHITQLELGSNKLTEIPTNIGCLINLRHLDLYNNQLEDLPVSVSQLKSLRWLDVKGNPLNPQLKRAAGDCLNSKECETAAKNVILHLKQVQSIMEKQRQKKLKEERDKEAALRKIEEQEKAKKRADKKAAKEKRKQEQSELNKAIPNGNMNGKATSLSDSGSRIRQSHEEMEGKNKKSGRGIFFWLNFIMFFMLLISIWVCIDLYTSGDLSVKGLKSAYPRMVKNGKKTTKLIMKAVEFDNLKKTGNLVMKTLSDNASLVWVAIQNNAGGFAPYLQQFGEMVVSVYEYAKSVVYLAYVWLEKNIDWNYILSSLKMCLKYLKEQYYVICEELGKNEALVSAASTVGVYTKEFGGHVQQLMNVTIEHIYTFSAYVQNEGPILLQTVTEHANTAYVQTRQSIEKLFV